MESLDQIWRDYHEGLLGFIRRRVGAADLAEDVLQDVFVKAHSRLDTLANADRIQSWLYQIARNTIIDYYRARKSAEPLPDEVAEQPEHDDLPSDFLRVEFKTRMVDEKTLRGRFHREPGREGENYQKAQFEDEQIRVTRLVRAPGIVTHYRRSTSRRAVQTCNAAAAHA